MTSTDAFIQALEPIISRVRTDITALKRNGKMIWTSDPLTPDRLILHFEGSQARGVCPIKAGESTTRLAVLDLDCHHGESTQGEMMAAARKISEALHIENIHTIPFRSSGGKGIHLYMIWDDPQDAYSLRTAIRSVINKVGFRDGAAGVVNAEVEIFPKQNNVKIGGCGSQVILPLTGASEPLDIDAEIELGKEAIFSIVWPVSTPVAKIETPAPVRASLAPTSDAIETSRLLKCIDPDVGYDDWLKIGMAIHYDTDGSDEGFNLWDVWSSFGSKYSGSEELRYKWDTFDSAREDGVTLATVKMIARDFGYVDAALSDFEALPDHSLETSQFLPTGRSERLGLTYNKHGQAHASVANLTTVIERPHIVGLKIGTDSFRDEIMYAEKEGEWQPFRDVNYTRIQRYIEKTRNFLNIGYELLRRVVADVADANRFDSAQEWLEKVVPEWDGTPRIDTFMSAYLGADDTPYTRAVGSYLWTGFAGRVLSPGCKADMVPILVGKQGIRKSSAVKAMVPSPDFFREISFGEKDDDLARKMRGCLVAEIGELKGLTNRDMEDVKAFIARTHEVWVQKFKEFATIFARRCMIIGTTNQDEFLADETGSRRWLPVTVASCNPDAIARDRDQLWAEGRDRFKLIGVDYADAELLAAHVHEKHVIVDVWQEHIEEWLSTPDLEGKAPIDAEMVRMQDIFRFALNFDAKQIKPNDQRRAGKILRALGFEKVEKRVSGVKKKGWAKPPPASP